ncbi:DUF2085 domain-containing protein, partial [Candidatus Calescamantes bacterium]|nr:DUF2085 domain-containing protein [Candidatus Calescamantes bacterium]
MIHDHSGTPFISCSFGILNLPHYLRSGNRVDNYFYDLLGGFCSQDPGHTFACVRGELGLCARCFGIYCGIFAAYIYYLFTRKSERHH